ncbi:DNA mismatch repair protein [Lachnellula hyalina]|uniref:DNA mismatch repair protein n=1 Tax=Lachnellula hyalina TaxID=1316788 RepID=A0A8H8R4F5_9HELO|nr:DNA mismatch repair protein [Lachnellula hyalina]TVY28348.1 DNA mismatch repair protein [Lachnellula hyalina]
MSIQPLPPDVIAQIKSSIAITSLNGVLRELVKNSLDASSTKIDISVNYARGSCVVEDDGLGILPSEFREGGGLGKLYHSSKINSENQVHGGRGIFLASLSSLALLSITSHHHLHRSHNTSSMHKSEVVGRQTPAPAQQYLQYPDHGTRVTVRDLFGGMPVRVRQRAIAAEKQGGNSKDWEELRRSIVALLLSWQGTVSVTVREAESPQRMTFRPQTDFSLNPVPSAGVSIPKTCTLLSQASFITPADKLSWVTITASIDSLTINGAISLDPSATKHVQFLSFGIQPLMPLDGQSILHDEINRLFLNSAFGNEEEAGDLADAERIRRENDGRYKSDGYTNKELKGGKKGVDRWPMFYINIQQALSLKNHRNVDVDDVLDDKGSSLGTILELLRAMILEFLTQHYFRPKAGRGHKPRRKKQEDVLSQTLVKSLQDAGNDATDAFRISRPTSAPNFEAVKDSSIKRKKPTAVDALGTNVKLPSFRRSSSQVDSPFDGWSKVKRGAAVPKLNYKTEPHHRPASASPSVGRQGPNIHSMEGISKPLLSKSGRLIRRPFEDLVTSTPQPRARPPSQPKIQTTEQDSEGDELVEWINPVTKVKSLVNKRTGLTVIASKEKRDNQSGKHGIRQGSLYSQQNLKRFTTPPTDSTSPWIRNILKTWENPVFNPVEPSIQQVATEGVNTATQSILHGRQHHCSQIDIDRAFKESSAGITDRISKDALRNAEVISQVDKKFILVKLHSSTHLGETAKNGMLVIVDQHAADERIRIEALMEELCTPPMEGNPPLPIESRILTTYLDKPLAFEISAKEVALLDTHRRHFADWGILYDLPAAPQPDRAQRLQIRYLPPGIIERCKLDPRVLVELIRTEAWNCSEKAHTANPPTDQDWLHRIHNCPQGIIDMLNSRACRSAIMFNDELSREQCELLVRKLAGCMFPFQCAHGRPSLIPLVNLAGLRMGSTLEQPSEGVESFGKAFGAWSQTVRTITK